MANSFQSEVDDFAGREFDICRNCLEITQLELEIKAVEILESERLQGIKIRRNQSLI